MRNVILIYALLVGTLVQARQTKTLSAPTGPETKDSSKTFVYVDEMPKAAFDYNDYLVKNMQYPDSAIAHNIEGRVIIKFIVNEDGHISDCEVLRGFDKDCDAEALRVVRNMPAWKPGKVNGEAVKVWFNLPISFKLTD